VFGGLTNLVLLPLLLCSVVIRYFLESLVLNGDVGDFIVRDRKAEPGTLALQCVATPNALLFHQLQNTCLAFALQCAPTPHALHLPPPQRDVSPWALAQTCVATVKSLDAQWRIREPAGTASLSCRGPYNMPQLPLARATQHDLLSQRFGYVHGTTPVPTLMLRT
jgi:hypothetical protein